jgi:hypothetical protein
MQHVVLTVPQQMADEEQSGLDIPQPAMTKKTNRAMGTNKRSASAKPSPAEELGQLGMFQEDEFHEDNIDEHVDEHVEQQFEEDYGEEAADVDFAAMEEAVHEAEEVLEADIHEEPGATSRARRRKPWQRSERSGGINLLVLTGWLLLVAAAILLAVNLLAPESMVPFLDRLQTAGLTPTAMLLIGVVVTGVGMLSSRQANIELRVVEVEATLLDNDTGMSASLDYLVEAQERHLDRPPASGEELNRVLVVLERQDEKVNNLTRAIKMYGKPLIEITKQMTDVTARIEALRASLGTVAEAVDGSGMEEALSTAASNLQKQISSELDKILSEISNQSDDSTTRMLEELKKDLAAVATSVDKLQRSGGVAPRHVAQPASGPAAAAAPTAAPAASGSPGGPSHEAPGDLAHSISGTKRSSGKGVLGSIAKLKKMRQ